MRRFDEILRCEIRDWPKAIGLSDAAVPSPEAVRLRIGDQSSQPNTSAVRGLAREHPLPDPTQHRVEAHTIEIRAAAEPIGVPCRLGEAEVPG
jgi:hypothetical protein